MYIVVEGPIGVGKTSLCKILSEVTGSRLNLEVVEENPFLADFYQDAERFGFNVQVFFLLSRFKQLSSLVQESLFDSGVVSDYMFDKDFIFASMNLKDAEFNLYKDLYSHLSPQLRIPDLTVYLRADVPVLLERIARRGRDFERSIDPDYLRNLNHHYDQYFLEYPGNLLVVQAAEFDFVGNLEHRRQIAEAILEHVDSRLKSTLQLEKASA